MDSGWGNNFQRPKDRRRPSSPRDDRRGYRQRSPTNSRHSARSHGSGKRAASPARNPQPSKKSTQRDEWMTGGKEDTAKWSGYLSLKLKIRSFGHSDTQNLIARVKETDNDLKEIFYKSAIPYDQRATEELSKHLSLHKELGIPAYESKKRSVSLNFYYAKVLKMCYDHVNSLRNKESTDQSMVEAFDDVIEHNKRSPIHMSTTMTRTFCLHTFANLMSTLEKERITNMRDSAYGFRITICLLIISRNMNSMTECS
jgi:hypothetical protein